ncbi:MAG: phage major tail tube protein [Lachnospiraceae bacterium]|nr:phage major tail tube protein [Lachnospiraceae bacterium]
MEKMTAIQGSRVYDVTGGKKTLALEDAEVTLPGIEAQTFEVKAMGAYNVPLPGLFESMEMTIKATGASKQYASISGFSSRELYITACQSEVAASGKITPKQLKAHVIGVAKKIGEISVNPGDASEPETTYELSHYELYIDNFLLWKVDKLTGECQVWNGTGYDDYGAQMEQILGI